MDVNQAKPRTAPDDPSPAGIDLDRLAEWMDGHGLGTGPVTDVVKVSGGTQNILVRFRRAGREYILRRPPVHKRDNSDETMRREARVLGALAGSGVPHPGLVAACPDTDVLGAAFYLMEPVDGFNPGVELPDRFASDPLWQREMGFAMADALAALGAVDIEAAGLGDLGRPEGWIERQPARWRKQLDAYSAMDGYPGPDIPGVDRLTEWLAANLPTMSGVGLLHGDGHFANALFHRDRPALAALIDWELSTIGDPLLDLGHLLATWPGRGTASMTPYPDAPGLPALPEVVARYAERSGRDVSTITWYHVLACYRLAVIVEGTFARACAGRASPRMGDVCHQAATTLVRRGCLVVDGDLS